MQESPSHRARLERLLRYCARPPFALDRLRQRGADRVYHCPQTKCGGKQADLVLLPLELNRAHRRPGSATAYALALLGVLAPNALLRAAIVVRERTSI